MFKAIVITHYDFVNSKGVSIKTSKLRVSLNDYGYLELCSDLANDLPIFSECHVDISYDNKKHKYVVTEIKK